MKNFEIKLRIENVDHMADLINNIGAIRKDDMHQTDYYLSIGKFKKKIREIERGDIQIISYDRFEKLGKKESKYDIQKITSKEKTDILNREKIMCVVEKIRKLWIYKHTRIHLDMVVGLGHYLELETVIKDISAAKGLVEFTEVSEILQIDPQRAIAGSYSDLIIEKQKVHPSHYFTNNFANC